jgi:hypothetical protein
MKSVLQIISEEIKLWEYENQHAYNVHDLGRIMQHMGYEKQTTEILTNMLLTAYRKSGDKGVVDRYLQMTGTHIYPISSGRYVFGYEPTGGGEPQLEGVGDKYAERKWGIPDQDNQYIRQTDAAVQKPEMGKLAGYAGLELYGNEPNNNEPIYLNPRSLNNFEKGVRAVSDTRGNLYVAQHDGDFLHGAFKIVMGNDVEDIYEIDKCLTWHRIKNSNKFGLATSSAEYLTQINAYNDKKKQDRFNQNVMAVKDKNPNFEFIPLTFYFIDEGVGDKYAERKFGIPDDQEINYIRQTSAAIQSTDMGKLVGQTTSDYEDSQLSPVYLNPVSLKNFENDVRAVSDLKGNLYVAQLDGNFVHTGFNTVIGGHTFNTMRYITWVRLGNTNGFAYSDSFMGYAQQPKNNVDVEQRLNVLRNKHPEFKFIPEFYYFAKHENNLDEQEKKTPQEIADNLVRSEYWDRVEKNNPQYYKEPIVANVDVRLADQAFRRDPDYYIGKDDKGIGNRKERVGINVEDGTLRYAPDASIRMINGQPLLSFADGRHRFAVLRDLGVKTINITFPQENKDLIHLLQH